MLAYAARLCKTIQYTSKELLVAWSVRHTRAYPGPRRARASALKLEMLLWEYTVGEHVTRTGPYRMLG